MAFSADDIATLKSALASGALRVRFTDGRLVEYRSVAEIRQIIRMAEDDADGTSYRAHSVAGF